MGAKRKMRSARFDGEDMQPFKQLLQACGVLRRTNDSDTKTQHEESVELPVSTSKKQRCVSNGANESTRITRQRGISKDEAEVVETLNGLADMFSHTNKPGNSIIPAQDSAILKVEKKSRKKKAIVTANDSSANIGKLITAAEGLRKKKAIVTANDSLANIGKLITAAKDSTILNVEKKSGKKKAIVTANDSLANTGKLITAAEDSAVLNMQKGSEKLTTTLALVTTNHSSPSIENSIISAKDSAILNVQDSSEKVKTSLTLEATNHSSANVANFRSLYDSRMMFGPNMIQSFGTMTSRDEVSGSEIQSKKYCHAMEEKHKGLLISPSSTETGVLSSTIRGRFSGSSDNRIPDWYINALRAARPSPIGNSCIDANKIPCPQVVAEPKKSSKRSSTHGDIAHLVKVMQTQEAPKGVLLRTSQLTYTHGDVERARHESINDQNRIINGPYGRPSFHRPTHSASNAAIANASFVRSSPKPSSGFCSLGARGFDTGEGSSRLGTGFGFLKRYNASNQNPQNLSSMRFSMPHNGYSSMVGGYTSAQATSPKVQFPPYYNLAPHQHNSTTQIQAQHNLGRVVTEQPHLKNLPSDPP